MGRTTKEKSTQKKTKERKQARCDSSETYKMKGRKKRRETASRKIKDKSKGKI